MLRQELHHLILEAYTTSSLSDDALAANFGLSVAYVRGVAKIFGVYESNRSHQSRQACEVIDLTTVRRERAHVVRGRPPLC